MQTSLGEIESYPRLPMVEKTATPQMMHMAASINVRSRTLRRMGPWNWLYEEKAMMEPKAIPIELNTCNRCFVCRLSI